MKYCLLLFWVAFTPIFISAQQVKIIGKVTDNEGNILPGATINYQSKKGTVADKEGNFYIATETEKPLNLTVRFIGYSTVDTLIHFDNKSTAFVNIKMKLELNQLPNVEIKADYQNVFENYKHHIVDFTISNDIIYLIIQKGRNQFLTRANLKGTILYETKIKDEYKQFYNSCLGGIILTGNESCAELHVLDDKVFITNEFNINYFNKYIVPCKLQIDETLIFKGISRHNKKIDYFRYYDDHNPHILYTVYDEEGENVSKSYFYDLISRYYFESENVSTKDIDYGFERENLIDDGTWNGDIQDLIISNLTHEYALKYQALGLKAVKSDLFVIANDVFILDEFNNQIVQIDEQLSYSMPVDEFKSKGQIKILSDYKNESYFLIDNIIHVINIENNKFEIQPIKNIDYSYFTQRHLLYKGTLYRLGRESINTVKKTIFRDPIK